MNYYENEFIYSQYEKLLEKAKTQYEIKRICDFTEDEHELLLRHDIDYSIEPAYRLATLENKNAVHSTYYVLMNSMYYNPLQRDMKKRLREMAEMGHEVGIHFDALSHDTESQEDLLKAMQYETDILEHILGSKVRSVSYHMPSFYSSQLNKKLYLNGLVNCYSDFFKSTYNYCSDSYGFWRFDHVSEVVDAKKNPRVQLLTHPLWWVHAPEDRKQRALTCFEADHRNRIDAFSEIFHSIDKKE